MTILKTYGYIDLNFVNDMIWEGHSRELKSSADNSLISKWAICLQAMNFFAALLLLMMPEENAFW